MKQNLRLGDCYALAKHKRKQYTIRYISLLAVVTSMCLYAVKQVSAQTAEPAATAVIDNEPLQIGDTIPEWLWNLPLQVVNHATGRNKITLNEYRGRLILLDFWALGCGSCIAALPLLDSMQQAFNDRVTILPVQSANRQHTESFWKKNRIARSIKLPTVVADTLLHRIFPHLSISHVVWIDTAGVICTTTGTDLVRPKPINWVLDGHRPNWLPKVDLGRYDGSEPLFPNIGRYYSAWGGYREGLTSGISSHHDSISRTFRKDFVNVSLYRLILYSYGTHPTLFPPSHVIWKVHKKNNYLFNEDASERYPSQWERKHHYTYEAVFPQNTADSVVQLAIRQDLQRYFPGLEVKLQNHLTDCLALVKRTESLRNDWSARPTTSQTWSGSAAVADVLNRWLTVPVVDRGEVDENIWLPSVITPDIDRIREVLRKQGYDLIPARAKLTTLTITDTENTFQNHYENQ